uniref:Uncharacterized protein n=1 Tax=Erpetoichthys calabaricus TaxID=27687 RepID=A0A8C4XB50_ERPCA
MINCQNRLWFLFQNGGEPFTQLFNNYRVGNSNQIKLFLVCSKTENIQLIIFMTKLTSCGVEASSFTGLKNLTDFTLTNNKLDNLKKSWFFDMWQLQKLNLAFNFISYLPPHTFDNLWQLQKLNLSSNGILYISTGSFFGLLSLTDLDLSSNDMVFINTDAFEPLVSVKHIDVSHNRLKTLPDLPKLVASLLLQNNSWHCSCQFVQLLERLKDKLKDSRTVTCSSPEEAKDSPALMAFAMVCSSNTTDEVLPTITSGPRENGSSWIYGFIGNERSSQKDETHCHLLSIRDKKSSMRLSVTQHDPFSASSNLGFGLRQADQDDIKTPQPMVNLDDVPQNSPNNETDTVGRIRLCKTAPSLLPAPDIFTSSSGSKGGLDAIKLRGNSFLAFGQQNNNASPSGLFKVESSESSNIDQSHRHFQMTRHSSNKQKVEGSTWAGELLTRERFWKYHTNCCDEYRPCPTARKVIKRLRNAKVIVSEGADDITRPPCDLELLKNNEVLEMNLLVKLQEREERKNSTNLGSVK